MSQFDKALGAAAQAAETFAESLGSRAVWPRATYDEMLKRLGVVLQADPMAPEDVVAELAELAEPGLSATGSGRFFGYVIGGAQPAALAADWLTSTWDQNAALVGVSPAASAVEMVAARWLLDLLDLPRESSVGFVTGATMANFTCLAAARHQILARAGFDVERIGLAGCPQIRVLVGADRHDSVDLAVRYLGLGADAVQLVSSDDEGRIEVDALRRKLAESSAPTIVCLQAGEVHTGAFDPFEPAIQAAHQAGAWVHVDGAFGLWARAGQTTRWLTAGLEAADSWCTDCHKTLNVPYDSGLAIVRSSAAHHAAFAVRSDYLMTGSTPEPLDVVPEISRRARGFAVWAALRALGRRGVAELVDRLHSHARRMAAGIAQIEDAEVLNDVVFTQVMASFADPEVSAEVGRRILASGAAVVTAASWRGRAVQRISVSNWATTEADVDATVEAMAGVAARLARPAGRL
ncbi:MAG: pyridoxal phosphate-dependent decarboxylase family protein [Nocardioidaceae bacterium]